MRLDLGGIAKGFATDEALAALARNGIDRAMVNASGDMSLGAPPPGSEGWKIGIAPLDADEPPSRFLRLERCGVATSGDLWQFVEINGRRYSHILDPRTGMGLTERSSVTVVAPDGITADSLASAVSVLGPDRGLLLAEETEGASALVVTRFAEKIVEFESVRFRELRKSD
jgi:thiamine biosynthesis lipoprotein